MNEAHVVYLRSGRMLLVKRPGADWRQLQDQYEDYMASLGPWTAEEIAEHFALDYGDDETLWPFPASCITRFMAEPNRIELEGPSGYY